MALLKIGELTLEHFLDLILGNFWRLWAIRGVIQFWASCFILGTHHRAIITNEYKTDDRSINPGYDCDDQPQIELQLGFLETQFAVFIFISAISCSLWFSEEKKHFVKTFKHVGWNHIPIYEHFRVCPRKPNPPPLKLVRHSLIPLCPRVLV